MGNMPPPPSSAKHVRTNTAANGKKGNAKKSNLERHVLSKHSENEVKRQRQRRTLKFCKEEGCTYVDSNGELKKHMERKHEGIVRFKCHVMNCSFRSSEHKELRRHAKTHEKRIIKD